MLELKETYDGARGTKEAFAIAVGELPNGQPNLLPVLVVSGVDEGETFVVNAGTRGDEILGIEAARQAWVTLEPDAVRGRVIFIPNANHVALATRTPQNPVATFPNVQDLDAIWPGDASGTISERTAALITDRFLAQADFAVDLHCAPVGTRWLAYATVPPAADLIDDQLRDRTHAYASSFDAPLILERPSAPGTFESVARHAGALTTTVNFGVATFSTIGERIWGRERLLNLIAHAGLIDPVDRDERPLAQKSIAALHAVRADRGGYLHWRALEVGAEVEEGSVIAVLLNLVGETLMEFRAPRTGTVVMQNTMGAVATGEIVAIIGEDSTL